MPGYTSLSAKTFTDFLLMFCVFFFHLYTNTLCVLCGVVGVCAVCVGVGVWGLSGRLSYGCRNSYIKRCSPKFISSLNSKDTSQQHRQAVTLQSKRNLKKI